MSEAAENTDPVINEINLATCQAAALIEAEVSLPSARIVVGVNVLAALIVANTEPDNQPAVMAQVYAWLDEAIADFNDRVATGAFDSEGEA